ncbi:MAG: cytochrome c3 family protein [bacterium]
MRQNRHISPATVRTGRFAGLILGTVGLLLSGWAHRAAADEPAERPIPDVVVLDELAREYEPVPFDHRAHMEMAAMWNGCATCHHHSPEIEAGAMEPAAEVPACRSCHAIDPKEAAVDMPSLRGAYHRQCLNCHKDWSGENDCEICHAPHNADSDAASPTPDDITGRMHPPLEPPGRTQYVARFTPAAGPYVTFRHEQHVQRYGIDCAHCHHRDTCADCHADETDRHGPQRPVKPAVSWRESHGPCMTCHQDQPCAKCHHEDPDDPPPAFDHRVTGQALDDDHAALVCGDCHRDRAFDDAPRCDNGACHGDQVVSLPKDRPGPVIDESDQAFVVQLAKESNWASLRPRPLPAEVLDRDRRLAQAPRPSAIAHAAAPGPSPRLELFDDETEVRMPERGDSSCVTDECHVAVKAYDRLHAPLTVDACDACHELVDEKEHRFTLHREGKQLCTYCHTAEVPEGAAVVHEPVRSEQCLGCHNPHGGSTRRLLREASVAATCHRCHDQVTRAMDALHTPVRDGECIACHAPHAARLPGLLDAAGSDLCLSCHQQFGQQLAEAPVTHEALDEQCDRCHHPHGADQPLALVEAIPQLCYECHESIQQTATGAAFDHRTAVEAGRACLNCHTPHGGNLDRLMRDLPRRRCLDCHDEPVETADHRTVGSVEQLADEQRFGHGPVRDGQCGGCHQPHGSHNRALLSQPYETRFHQRFTDENYAFCFQCHDANLVVQQSSGELPATRFRNGETNLHALHVNDRWGRSCSVCHATHTAENAKLVRATLRFKQWEAPIGFQPTDTGGFCRAGCHVPLSYDREDPVSFDGRADKSAPQPVRAAPRAPIRLTATDHAGAVVTVPDRKRPSVLVLLRSKQGGNGRDDLEPLLAALPEPGAANVVVIVTGPGARDVDETLARMDAHWHIVTDPRGEQSESLDVHAWPMVLVVDARGRQRARLSGEPVTLAIRLQGYLNATDRDDVVRPEVAVIHDVAERRIDQYLALTDRLRRDGEPEQANRILSEAIEMHPEALPLRLAQARTLIELGRAEAALAALDKLPEATRHGAPGRLVQARALAALNRGERARALVEPLTDHDTVGRDALLLLARIHQDAGRWREAAECYDQAQARE